MARVIRTPQARRSLKECALYIAEQSQSRAVALRFLSSIEEKCQLCSTQPQMGTFRPDLDANVRCFPVGNHVVIYRPLNDGILVLLVIRGIRDIPAVYRGFF